MKRTVGDFLLDRLLQVGVRDVFGVPGDYNLQFLQQIEKREDIRFVGTRNELNGAYAADGYARSNGIAALVTTYGVGDLSALNGIAGAFAEYVPVIFITGAPPLNSMSRHRLLHHTTGEGNFEDIMDCYRSFTVAQARITPQNAVEEIDRVFRACFREKRPVYLQLPSDISFFEIDVQSQMLSLCHQTSDVRQLESLLQRITKKLKKAENPAVLLGMALDRFELSTLTELMIRNLNLPFATLSAAQCVLDGNHAHWIGGYSGRTSLAHVKKTIEKSDCLFGLNVKFTDINSSYFTQNIPEDMISIQPFRTIIGHDIFEGVSAIELLGHLSTMKPPKHYGFCKNTSLNEQKSWIVKPEKKLIQDRFWKRTEKFIKSDDVIITEAGTSMRGVKIMNMPSDIAIISQPLWLSIGYSLPALFGSLMANSARRHLLFIGDGSLQFTAQEVSSLFSYDLKPIIFLINNKGYTIERAIMGLHAAYNNIPHWDYKKFFESVGNGRKFFTRKIETEGELDEALIQIDQHTDKLCLIEAMFDPLDIPKAMQDTADMVAAFNYGPRGLKELSKKRVN